MQWILIFWLLAAPAPIATTGTAVFADQQSCQGALQAIAQAWPGDAQGIAPGVCVPQAATPPSPPAAPPSAPLVAKAPPPSEAQKP